jgi:hypothetical protein
MTLAAWSLRNNGDLRSNGVNYFDEVSIIDGGSLSFDGRSYCNINSPIDLSGDFTVESWIYQTNLGVMTVFSNRNSPGNPGYTNGWCSLRNGFISCFNNGSVVFDSLGPVAVQQWSHIAWTRKGTTSTFFINGVSVASTTTDSATLSPGILGALSFNNTYPYVYNFSIYGGWFTGLMKDFRITTSSVYTSNFSVPTSSLTTSASTVLLLNVDSYSKRFINKVTNLTMLSKTPPNTDTVPPICANNVIQYSGLSPYTQPTPSTQAKIATDAIRYIELDEVTNAGSSTAFRLTNTGSASTSGIFDEISRLPTTSTLYSTPGNFTHVIPSGVNLMYVEAWGGGGGHKMVIDDTGGNYPSYTIYWVGESGAGGYCRSVYNVSTLSGKTLFITVGAGGAGGGQGDSGTSSPTPGKPGTTSTVSTSSFAFTTMTARGGSATSGPSDYYGAAGGTASGGNDVNITGAGSTTTFYFFSFSDGGYSPTRIFCPGVAAGTIGFFGDSYGAAGSAIITGNYANFGNPLFNSFPAVYSAYQNVTGAAGQNGAVLISYY